MKHTSDCVTAAAITSAAAAPLTHLGGAAVAEGLLREAAAALDVLLPLEERRKLRLQDLRARGGARRGDKVRGQTGRRGQMCEAEPAFCLAVQMFSRSVMRAVLR